MIVAVLGMLIQAFAINAKVQGNTNSNLEQARQFFNLIVLLIQVLKKYQKIINTSDNQMRHIFGKFEMQYLDSVLLTIIQTDRRGNNTSFFVLQSLKQINKEKCTKKRYTETENALEITMVTVENEILLAEKLKAIDIAAIDENRNKLIGKDELINYLYPT
ncbi:hypothetical protein RFI_30819 [Reticulomyxa filosa]|uniref:EF-hand domain-containing protein n=1 Tax=Reticulomyxa filosa TaxID=46433 RepID=X6LXA1_RETFI|nr:hypothetical protein RFI_30819 [Reticulomyxa filosa]|eukprot:ETO06573.1 hypothetical protein RFI_30819 [Reticulomyxa filosa]